MSHRDIYIFKPARRATNIRLNSMSCQVDSSLPQQPALTTMPRTRTKRTGGNSGTYLTRVSGKWSRFVDQWLDNPEIVESSWSFHQRWHRKTNAVEGWLHKINYNLPNPKARVKEVIYFLKKDAETTTHMDMRLELHLERKRGKTKYFKLDERIKKTYKKQETGGIMFC